MGTLYGNGKYRDDGACGCKQGDRIGVLLDMDVGSILFFKNGERHGPGYPAGSVKGEVVHAVQLSGSGRKVRLLGDAPWPMGHKQRAPWTPNTVRSA
jgi:hypothetical protein